MRRPGHYPRVYHVDPDNGSDSNPGSIDKPFETMAGVRSVTLRPGDKVLFKAGTTLRGKDTDKDCAAFKFEVSGTKHAPIYFGRYGSGEDPILDQAVPYTDFVVHSGNCYKRTAPGDDDFGRQIFQGEERLTKRTSIQDVIDNPGSWYGDGATNILYVHCTGGVNPNTNDVSQPGEGGMSRGIFFNGQSHIVIEHLHVKRSKNSNISGTGIDGSHNLVVKNCETSFSAQRGVRIYGDSSEKIYDCVVRNVVSHDNCSEGIWIAGTNTMVENCTLTNNKKGYVLHNTGGAVGGCGIISGVYSVNTRIRRCHVSLGYHNGMFNVEFEEIYGEGARPTGVIVEGNHFLNNAPDADSEIDRVCSMEGDATCIFRNNIVESTTGAQQCRLMTINLGAKNPKIYHNTFLQRKQAWIIGILLGEVTIKNNILRCTVANNMIYFDDTDSIMTIAKNRYSGGAGGTGFYAYTHNGAVYYTDYPTWETAVSDDSSVGVATLVDESEGGDYHLDVGSACIGAGADLDVNHDKDGVLRDATTPDIGAYEYVG